MEDLKRKSERQFDVVNSVTMLESMLHQHNTEDELCGDHIVIPKDKIDSFLVAFKRQITLMLSVELKKRDLSLRPLRDAVEIMNKERDGTRNTNEFATTNNN